MAGSAVPPYHWTWRRTHWLPTILAVILGPKCALCVAGYLAVATGFSVATPELCGAATDNASSSQWWFIVSATAISVCTFWLMTRQSARGIEEGENTKEPSSKGE